MAPQTPRHHFPGNQKHFKSCGTPTQRSLPDILNVASWAEKRFQVGSLEGGFDSWNGPGILAHLCSAFASQPLSPMSLAQARWLNGWQLKATPLLITSPQGVSHMALVATI